MSAPRAAVFLVAASGLACVALAGHRVGGGMWEFPSGSSGYVRVVCPGCDAEYEMDGFGDGVAGWLVEFAGRLSSLAATR